MRLKIALGCKRLPAATTLNPLCGPVLRQQMTRPAASTHVLRPFRGGNKLIRAGRANPGRSQANIRIRTQALTTRQAPLAGSLSRYGRIDRHQPKLLTTPPRRLLRTAAPHLDELSQHRHRHCHRAKGPPRRGRRAHSAGVAPAAARPPAAPSPWSAGSPPAASTGDKAAAASAAAAPSAAAPSSWRATAGAGHCI